MQAIQTKYLGPTNHRGSRIKATAGGGESLTMNIDNSRRIEDEHRRAAELLAARLNWPGRLVQGSLKDSDVFVFAD